MLKTDFSDCNYYCC